MQYDTDNKSPILNPKKRRRFITSIVCLVILLSLLPIGILKNASGNRASSAVIIRVDDIQDYAFRDAQLFLMDQSISNQVPLSLSVIAGMFGEDEELVEKTKLLLASESNVASHGWKHEDSANFSLEEQVDLLSKSKKRLQEIFGQETMVFVPPMFSFNDNTLKAMKDNGYTIFSAFINNAHPGLMSGIISVPGTIQLSVLDGEIWNMKNSANIREEISESIDKYGFAVLVTHPQEFLTDGVLDLSKMEIYKGLLNEIKRNYPITTLKKLGDSRHYY